MSTSPMEEIIGLVQDYKVAPPGPAAEAALAKVCARIERLYIEALKAKPEPPPTDPMGMREFFRMPWSE